MRDFRDAKAMAQTLRRALTAKGLTISNSDSLELIAQALGIRDWNTLSALIRAESEARPGERRATEDAESAALAPEESATAEGLLGRAVDLANRHGYPPDRLLLALEAAKVLNIRTNELEVIARKLGAKDWNSLVTMLRNGALSPPPSEDPASAMGASRPPGRGRGSTRFSPNLEQTLHVAVNLAAQRGHRDTTSEHLLRALADDRDAALVLDACAIDIDRLRAELAAWLDGERASAAGEDGAAATPTGAFQRIIQRAVIHVQLAGSDFVTGANVLVAIFSERDSRACELLNENGMTRLDAVNFIAHGIRKSGGGATA
ncbi:MAG TPA: glyoxalase superfamily protein [Caulobacteraceae bacterium]|nr:glyoxalase superfamily protein [Caulobacteraceae bacterium]